MKKLFLAVVCTFFATAMFAQRASSTSTSFFSSEKSDQPVTIGIRAGVNFANVSFSSQGYSVSPNSKTGFNVGLSLDVPMLESFYFQSGLYLSTKGFEMKEEGMKMEANPMYLEIPVLASYRYDFNETSQLQINFGPYFAYGIGGKAKVEQYGRKDEGDFFGKEGIADEFDCGLQIGAGVTFGKVYVGCAYQFGLTSIANSDMEKQMGDLTVKNKNFMVNLGYNF